jgi:hypothetical protein
VLASLKLWWPIAASGKADGVDGTTRRRRTKVAAPQKERDDLAESLAQIEAYQPGVLSVAKAWAAHRPIYITL